MLRHIVLLEFADDISDARRTEIMEDLGALRDAIPEILAYTWGPNVSSEGLDKGLTCGFIMEFADADALARYLTHPEHVKIAGDVIVPALKNGTDSLVVFDLAG